MKIRFGLVLAVATGLGLNGCAAGTGSGGGGGGGRNPADALAELRGGQGQPPRETPDTDQAEEFLESAEEAADEATARTLYQNALASAEAAIAADPNNPLGHRLAALAQLGLENYEAAATHFEAAGELYPVYEFEDAQLREEIWIELYNEGMPLINQGEYDAAVEKFEAANSIYQDRPEAFITAAQLYAQLRQHDRALEKIDRAQEIIENVDAEVTDAETLAAWQAQAADLPTLRAQVLSDAGRFEEAAAVFSRLVAENPTDVEATRNLAATQLQMGDEEAAFRTYEQLLSNPNLTAPDFYQIGIGFYQGENYEQAARAFSEAVALSPMDRDGLEMWARSLQLGQMYDEVPAVAERWRELDPNSQTALLLEAQAVNQLGDSQRAGELVQMVEGLDVVVDELQMIRLGTGGARVTGSVVNSGVGAGQTATLTFTFYSATGAPLGTVTETVSVPDEEDVSTGLTVVFESDEDVGGYGYELTVG